MTAIVQHVPDSMAGGKRVNKAIFLFSDGTGNSSAKLFKTNVWRLYEMLDLGPAPEGAEVQIAYYDNGVGTSSFRPLAMLGGIFGFGLKRNVLRLYTFLCRNYEKGDRIYAFGFSRGAFTIRLLAALIDKQGVLSEKDDSDLAYLVHDAYREYCRDNFPPRWSKNFRIRKWIAQRLRWVRDAVISAKRRWRHQVRYEDFKPERPVIEFVGVWDTVAAYGGPFAELTRGIDDWVWPLSLPNYTLPAKVITARHALSLDDERDAFWPLIWDETGSNDETRTRLQQVWFSGVHSDVGGGYPDESLSFTSLTWMMDELVATRKGGKKSQHIRFIPQLADRTAAMANALGPIHNSRAGFAAYYRYQPRKITAFLKKYRQQTESMRDPQGIAYLDGVLVHESVLARIVSGVDNYAPAALPPDITPVVAEGPYSRRLLTDEQLRTDLGRTAAERTHRFESQENEWDAVWWRRTTYFLTVGATLLLIALPSVAYLTSIDRLCSDDRCFAPDVSRALLFFLPDGYRGWLTPWAALPISTLFWAAIIMTLIWSGTRTERSFRDAVRKSWDRFRKGSLKGPEPKATTWRRRRESPTYQGALRWFKWSALPLVFGWLALAVLAYLAIVVGSQTLYAIAEPHDLFCSDQRNPNDMTLNASCTNLAQTVKKGQLYQVTLQVRDDWKDDTIAADPVRGAHEETWLMSFGRPLKRMTNANWLQPITEIRADRAGGWRYFEWLFGKDIEMRRSQFRQTGAQTYVASDLCPRRSGQLHILVNDAAPLLVAWPYWNNLGSANVTVTHLGIACTPK
jgi:uncharacterized protein (DUF2235 family)